MIRANAKSAHASNMPSTTSSQPQFKVLYPEDFVAPPRPEKAGKLVLTPELEEELRRKSSDLESATPQEIIQWAVDRFAQRFTMATAFGPEGMVILHMLAEIAPDTPVFN